MIFESVFNKYSSPDDRFVSLVATKKRKYSPQECDTKNKSFPATCLFIFLSYILLYSP